MLSPDAIEAVASTYTVEELQTKIATLTAQLVDSPGTITSASSGGGTSYTRTEGLSVAERLELLKRALAYKQGDTSAAAVGQNSYIVFNPVLP